MRLKRFVDIIGSVVGITISLPIVILTAILVAWESKSFPFYKQKRVGLNGEIFTIYKIRSMVKDADKISNWTIDDDPRILKIGKYIRKWNIDELPQFWNVLTGDMSLVGPRPETPENVEKFENEFKTYHLRKQVKPGMTGLSQAFGYRGDTCMLRRTILDNYYVYNQSVLTDFILMVETLKTKRY